MAQSSREIYRSAILADCCRSGLTQVEFCKLRRISIHSFRSWLYRLRPVLPPPRPRTRRESHPPARPSRPGPPSSRFTFQTCRERSRPLWQSFSGG